MMDKKLDQELKAFDYSQLSDVREGLLSKLLARHRMDNSSRKVITPAFGIGQPMSEDDLDYVAAAGVASMQEKHDK